MKIKIFLIGLDAFSNYISNNTNDIKELKELYKSFMQSTLDINKNENSSPVILDELSKLREDYSNNFLTQTKHINLLEERISNINFTDDFNVISDKLTSVKITYENSITSLSKQINLLDERISNEEKISNNAILDEINFMKQTYNNNIITQSEQISLLEEKISNIEITDNSDVILDELTSMKQLYENNFITQSEQISLLENKVSNIKITDNSDIILDELTSIKQLYENNFITQSKQINLLENKISNINANTNNEVLQQVSSIFKQLDIMNSRFNSLEQKAVDNELLIKNMTKINKDITLHNKSKTFDAKKLNEKVIQIQDYLENNNNIKEFSTSIKSKSTRRNKNILDGQINIIDDLIKNAVNYAKKYEEKHHVTDYNKVENKRKTGFSLFKSKNKGIIQDEPEEEITIVSQILNNINAG